jgi:hypothetical protein
LSGRPASASTAIALPGRGLAVALVSDYPAGD